MRVLSGIGFVTEMEEKTYLANVTTKSMTEVAVAASIIHL